VFDIGFGEIVVLAVLALFVFGPEKLPKVAADAVKTLRDVRTMAANARDQITEAVDPELQDIDIKSLDPREFVRRAIDDDPAGAAASTGAPRAAQERAARGDRGTRSGRNGASGSPAAAPAPPAATPWDADAT
jgi:sec-independent protein translocase protein TatB